MDLPLSSNSSWKKGENYSTSLLRLYQLKKQNKIKSSYCESWMKTMLYENIAKYFVFTKFRLLLQMLGHHHVP